MLSPALDCSFKVYWAGRMAGGGNYDSRSQIGASGNGFASESGPIETRKTKSDGGDCQTRRPEAERLGRVVASIHRVAAHVAQPAKRECPKGHYGTRLGAPAFFERNSTGGFRASDQRQPQERSHGTNQG